MEANNSIQMAPTVHPTSKEFANFEEYMQGIENKYSKQYGMVKVVPPRSWIPHKKDYESSIQTGQIPQPIEQNAYGKGGIYECLHMVQKSLSMKEYRRRNQKFDHITEGKSIEECENLFYKNIGFSPPIYGADSRSTLFDPGCQWNLGELKNLLQKGVNGIISGVNDPYLYVGAWKTLFAWHKEDLDLGAINYHHYGKPKFWYAIPEEDHHYIEKMAKLYFADNFNKCSEHMRHKTTVINPYLLKKRFPECRINKMIQKEREFIIVFQGAYHHGFNYGFNIAEAVNFCTTNWLAQFLKAKICKCIGGLVKINHREFYENIIMNSPELKNNAQVKQFLKEIKRLGFYDQQLQTLPIQQQQQEEQQQQGKKVILKNVKSSKVLPITKKAIRKAPVQRKTKQQQSVIEKPLKKNLPVKQQQQQIKQTVKQGRTSSRVQDKQICYKSLVKQQPILQEEEQQQQKKQQKRKQKIQEHFDDSQNSNNSSSTALPENNNNKSRKRQQQQKMEIEQQQQQQNNNSLPNNVIVDDWLQCDDCKKWRKIDQSLKSLKRRKHFYCENLSVKCKSPEQDIKYSLV